jgi:hypothetical protein
LSRVGCLCVTYKMGFGLEDWIYWHLIYTTCHYSANCQFRRLDWIQFLCSEVRILAGWRLETRLRSLLDYCPLLPNTSLQPLRMDLTENTASNVKEVCVLIRCVAVYVLLLSEFAFAGMCLPSRCLAVDIHVTISSSGSPTNYYTLRN